MCTCPSGAVLHESDGNSLVSLLSQRGGVPVVDSQGALVGMLTRTDLIDHLIRLVEPVEGEART